MYLQVQAAQNSDSNMMRSYGHLLTLHPCTKLCIISGL
jgi:hypothetical protein